MEEEEHGYCHQHRTEHQMKADLVQSAFDEDGLITDRGELEVGRQNRPELLQTRFDGVDELHGVAARLFADDERHGIVPIETR